MPGLDPGDPRLRRGRTVPFHRERSPSGILMRGLRLRTAPTRRKAWMAGPRPAMTAPSAPRPLLTWTCLSARRSFFLRKRRFRRRLRNHLASRRSLTPAPLPFGDLCERRSGSLGRGVLSREAGWRRRPDLELGSAVPRRRSGFGSSSGRGKGGGAAQVVDDREGDHVAGVAGKRRAAGAGEPVQALQGPEDALDGGAAAGDEGVAPRLPARQGGLVLVRAVHDAILDAARLEPGAALLALVALVAIDGALVAADEVVGDEALVHSGRGQHEPADQARALVDAGMEAIAEMGAAVLLRPVGVGLAGDLRPKA